MSFTGRLGAAETVSSITSITFTPDDVVDDDFAIVIGAFSAKLIQFRCSVGTAGVKNKIKAIVVTSASNTLEGEGYLFILDA
jgi:hypothetical protein